MVVDGKELELMIIDSRPDEKLCYENDIISCDITKSMRDVIGRNNHGNLISRNTIKHEINAELLFSYIIVKCVNICDI